MVLKKYTKEEIAHNLRLDQLDKLIDQYERQQKLVEKEFNKSLNNMAHTGLFNRFLRMQDHLWEIEDEIMKLGEDDKEIEDRICKFFEELAEKAHQARCETEAEIQRWKSLPHTKDGWVNVGGGHHMKFDPSFFNN